MHRVLVHSSGKAMWRKWRRRSLLVALLPKLSSTKTIWPVMQAQRFSVCRTFFFSTHNDCLWMIFIFRWNPMNYYFLIAVAYTHHSLDFMRKLKIMKITGYIHLHYKIPFLCGNACICVFFLFLFFFFLIIHREFCFNMFSVWYKVATHVSWEVLQTVWIKGH